MEPKDELTPLELRLVAFAAAGKELDCAPTGATEAELDVIDDWDDRKVRAEVLVALCTGEVPACVVWTFVAAAGRLRAPLVAEGVRRVRRGWGGGRGSATPPAGNRYHGPEPHLKEGISVGRRGGTWWRA